MSLFMVSNLGHVVLIFNFALKKWMHNIQYLKYNVFNKKG